MPTLTEKKIKEIVKKLFGLAHVEYGEYDAINNNPSPEEEAGDILTKLLADQKAEIEKKLPGEDNAFAPKDRGNCELYLDHQISWCGDCFACSNCGQIFLPVSQVKEIIKSA